MKKINKKRKGFTIVELVIVIAVIAILAGVLIPTFANVIEKANQSSDIQAVRQMNVILTAESVEEKPTNVGRVIEIISDGGYDTEEKRTPKSSGHGFYWHSGENLIVLVKGTSELIYPEDNAKLNAFLAETEDFNVTEAEDFHSIGTNAGTNGENEIPEDAREVNDSSGLRDALNSGATDIVLYNDIYITQTLKIESDVTIYLNKHNIYLDPEDGVSKSLLPISAEMNIVGSGTNGSGTNVSDTIYSRVSTSNYLTVKSSGKLNLTDTNIILEGDIGILNEGGEVIITRGVFTVNESGSEYNTMLYNESGGTMTVVNTVFNAALELYYGYGYGSPIYNCGELVMKGVTISSSEYCTSTNGGKLTIDSESTLNLMGKKFPAPEEEYFAYNCIYYKRPSKNPYIVEENPIFVYEGENVAIPKNASIELNEENTTWVDDQYFIGQLTIDLKGNTLTLDNCSFNGGNLIIKDSEGGGTINLVGDDKSIYHYFEHVDSVTISTNEEEYINITGAGSDLSPDAIVQMVVNKKMYYNTDVKDVSCKFNNCTFTNTSTESKLSIKNGDTIVFGSDVTFNNSILLNSTINLELSGHTLDILKNTITVGNGYTLNITGGTTRGTITKNKDSRPFIVDGGTLKLTNVTVQGGGSLFFIKNSGTATLDAVTLPTVALVEIINKEQISATNVSLDGKAALTKSSDKLTLDLNSDFTLLGDIIVPANSTINTNGHTLTMGSYSITVNAGCTLNVVGEEKNVGKLSATEQPVELAGGVVKLTYITVLDLNLANFNLLLSDIIKSYNSILSNVSYGNYFYEKEKGNKTTITLNKDKDDTTIFNIGANLVITNGYILTINLNNRELKIDQDVKVCGTLNITIAKTGGGGGNIKGLAQIIVESGGTLSVTAYQFHSSTKMIDSNTFLKDYVKAESNSNVTVKHP